MDTEVISEWKKTPSRWVKDGDKWYRVPVRDVPHGMKMVMARVTLDGVVRTRHILVRT